MTTERLLCRLMLDTSCSPTPEICLQNYSRYRITGHLHSNCPTLYCQQILHICISAHTISAYKFAFPPVAAGASVVAAAATESPSCSCRTAWPSAQLAVPAAAASAVGIAYSVSAAVVVAGTGAVAGKPAAIHHMLKDQSVT